MCHMEKRGTTSNMGEYSPRYGQKSKWKSNGSESEWENQRSDLQSESNASEAHLDQQAESEGHVHYEGQTGRTKAVSPNPLHLELETDNDVESLMYYVDSVLADQSMTDSPVNDPVTSRDVDATIIPDHHHRHHHHHHSHRDIKVVLDVGGMKFSTYQSTLRRIPNTRLSNLNTMDTAYDHQTGEYFFDRNPKFFASILDFYRCGELHFAHCLCGPSIKRELEFWAIDDAYISACCWRAYTTFEDEQKTLKVIEKTLEDPEATREKEDENSCETCSAKWLQSKWRQKLWTFMDKPQSSKFALVCISISQHH